MNYARKVCLLGTGRQCSTRPSTVSSGEGAHSTMRTAGDRPGQDGETRRATGDGTKTASDGSAEDGRQLGKPGQDGETQRTAGNGDGTKGRSNGEEDGRRQKPNHSIRESQHPMRARISALIKRMRNHHMRNHHMRDHHMRDHHAYARPSCAGHTSAYQRTRPTGRAQSETPEYHRHIRHIKGASGTNVKGRSDANAAHASERERRVQYREPYPAFAPTPA